MTPPPTEDANHAQRPRIGLSGPRPAHLGPSIASEGPPAQASDTILDRRVNRYRAGFRWGAALRSRRSQ